MLAKGFAVNGSIVFLVDINESMLLESKSECEIAASSVGTKPQLHTYVVQLSLKEELNLSMVPLFCQNHGRSFNSIWHKRHNCHYHISFFILRYFNSLRCNSTPEPNYLFPWIWASQASRSHLLDIVRCLDNCFPIERHDPIFSDRRSDRASWGSN